MLHLKKMGGSLPFLISLEFLKISAKLLFSIKHYKNWKYFSKSYARKQPNQIHVPVNSWIPVVELRWVYPFLLKIVKIKINHIHYGKENEQLVSFNY